MPGEEERAYFVFPALKQSGNVWSADGHMDHRKILHLRLLLVRQQANDFTGEVLVRPDSGEGERLAGVGKDTGKSSVLRN